MLTDSQQIIQDEEASHRPLSSTRFFNSVSHRRIQNIDEIAELIYGDADIYFEKIGIPETEWDMYRPLLHQIGHEEIFYLAAIADIFGLSCEWQAQHHQLVSFNRLHFDYAQKHLVDNYAQVTFPKVHKPVVLKHGDKKKERIKFVPATFRAFPGSTNVTAARVGSKDNVFAMYLPTNDFREVKRSLKVSTGEHIPGAFAYILFREKEGVFQITEIQSDVYGKMNKRSLREKYKHWSKQLLAVFEWYLNKEAAERAHSAIWHGRTRPEESFDSLTEMVESLMDKMDRVSKEVALSQHINLPTVGTIKRRWPTTVRLDEFGHETHIQGIATELGKKLYQELPRSLGYQILHVDPYTFPEEDVLGKDITVKNYWAKTLTTESEDPTGYLAQISSLSPSIKKETVDEWFLLLNEIFPPHLQLPPDQEGFPVAQNTDRRYLLNGQDFSIQIAQAFETAPLVPIAPLHIDGVTKEMHDTHQKYLASLPDLSPVTELFTPDHTFFSRGTENGTPLDWWCFEQGGHNEWTLQPLHIAAQDRHPTLRIVSPQGHEGRHQALSVGAKGAGLREIRESDVYSYKKDSEEYITIHLRNMRTEKEQGIEIPSHKFWGGLTYKDGTTEMLNALALLEMQQKLAPNMPVATAVPLDVGFLSSVPTYVGDETVWHDPIIYGQKYLDAWEPDISNRLVCYRSISPCDVRLSQVVNRVIERSDESRTNLEVAKTEIESALSFLYKLHGQDFHMHEGDIPVRNGRVRIHEILAFLSEIGEQNKQSAEKILKRFDNQTLRIMGLVHGAGGYLGGGWDSDEKLGAVGGGATSLRNIDAAFVVHDLDPDLYLPWIVQTAKYPEMHSRYQEATPKMQAMDLLFWSDSRYWLETILLGRALEDDERLCDIEIENRHNHTRRFGRDNIKVVGMPQLAVDRQGTPKISGLRELIDDQFDNDGTYKKHYALGRTYSG